MLDLCFLLGLACATADMPPAPVPPPPVEAPTVSAPSTKPPTVQAVSATPPVGFPACERIPPVRLQRHFVRAARTYPGATACELANQAWAESAFRVDAVSPVGAIGVSQFMPATADELGLDPWDPQESIYGQARYVNWCRARWSKDNRSHEDIVALGLGAYNWGVGSMYRSQRQHGWYRYGAAEEHLPAETRHYVIKITGRDR